MRVLARRREIGLRAEKGTRALVGTFSAEVGMVVLAEPLTYMNDSGLAAAALLRRYRVTDLSHLLVVHDELDLPVGTVRVKFGGGTAGHNGLRSIEAHAHGLGFGRIRLGIGRPPGSMSGADYVLRRPSRADAELLQIAEERAADAMEIVASAGIDAAMNATNRAS